MKTIVGAKPRRTVSPWLPVRWAIKAWPVTMMVVGAILLLGGFAVTGATISGLESVFILPFMVLGALALGVGALCGIIFGSVLLIDIFDEFGGFAELGRRVEKKISEHGKVED